ncbi:myc protein-like [Haliotis cracherodii]|uniref:myc protein-like n=1 Tax=Haliotis cracherodii TaxID=6455 RepID=UPI0039E90FE7
MPMKATPRILDTYMMSTPRCINTKDMAKIHSLEEMDESSMYSFMDNEGDVDFYNLNTPTLMPSEDIWKKFELLPTPPRSPKHEVSDLLDYESTDISDFLQNEAVLKPPNLPFPESPPPSSLCSKLIQDCMWSGSHQIGFDMKVEKSPSPGPDTRQNENGQTETPSDCVDPAAVFPYPISDTRLTNLGTETPSDSEEEIDVVSTEDVHESRIPSPQPLSINLKNVKTVTVRTESAKRESKSVHVVIGYPDMDVHNYSLPHSYKRTRSSPGQTHIAPKRIKRELSEPDFKKVCQKLKASSRSCSRNNSDSEEGGEGKRTQHNVLERKRRNDLKYSFFSLRDNVPELREKEKAPKVLILKKSADFIYELRRQEASLSKEVTSLKERHEKLRRTLSALRQ